MAKSTLKTPWFKVTSLTLLMFEVKITHSNCFLHVLYQRNDIASREITRKAMVYEIDTSYREQMKTFSILP